MPADKRSCIESLPLGRSKGRAARLGGRHPDGIAVDGRGPSGPAPESAGRDGSFRGGGFGGFQAGKWQLPRLGISVWPASRSRVGVLDGPLERRRRGVLAARRGAESRPTPRWAGPDPRHPRRPHPGRSSSASPEGRRERPPSSNMPAVGAERAARQWREREAALRRAGWRPPARGTIIHFRRDPGELRREPAAAPRIVDFAQAQTASRLLGIHRPAAHQYGAVSISASPTGVKVPAVLGGLQGDSRIAAAQPNYLYARFERTPLGARSSAIPPQYVVSTLHLRAGARPREPETRVLVAVIDFGDRPRCIPNCRGIRGGAVRRPSAALPLPHKHGTGMASAIGVPCPAARRRPGRAKSWRSALFDASTAGAQSTHHAPSSTALQWTATSGAAGHQYELHRTGPTAKCTRCSRAAHRNGMVLVAAAGNDGPAGAGKPIRPPYSGKSSP